MNTKEYNYNMTILEKCTGNIRDRIDGVYNDLKAYLYIRKHNLQHQDENIGGGNMVVGLSLFACLNFLGKTYYCTVRPDKFKEDGSAKNETEVFVHFSNFLKQNEIELGLPNNGSELESIWNGFRDYLAHRLAPKSGKSILTFIFEPQEKGTISEILIEAKKHPVFTYNDKNKDWELNGDALLAKILEITEITSLHILNQENIDADLLLKVIGTEYP
jgi:hypothetical protein